MQAYAVASQRVCLVANTQKSPGSLPGFFVHHSPNPTAYRTQFGIGMALPGTVSSLSSRR